MSNLKIKSEDSEKGNKGSEEAKKRTFLTILLKLCGIFFLIFAALVVIYFEDIFLQKPDQKVAIGLVKIKEGNVRIKYPNSINWFPLKEGQFIRSKSIVFTGKQSRVTYILIDGTIINQASESLLRLELKIKKRKKKTGEEETILETVDLELTKGSVQVTSSPPKSKLSKKNINLNKSIFKVDEKNSLLRINKKKEEAGLELTVVHGSIKYSSNTGKDVVVNKGEKLTGVQDHLDNNSNKSRPLKEKVPDNLLKEFAEEAKDNFDNGEVKKEFFEARKISAILRRILNGVFN